MEAAQLVNITREEGVHRKFAKALERFRRADTELGHAMDELIDAIEAMRELHVVVDIEMRPSTQAAWVEHRAAKRSQ